jgi:hypothetical protein
MSKKNKNDKKNGTPKGEKNNSVNCATNANQNCK